MEELKMVRTGISRDSRHKRSHTGAKRAQIRKKRKFELGRQAASTKIGTKRSVTRKSRVIRVIYNASNNELVRTNTLVKGAIVEVDAVPLRQWYESHYATALGRRKHAVEEETTDKKTGSNHVQRKVEARSKDLSLDAALNDQFAAGRVLARLSSRPGQSGRADGYILEGAELEFYLRKLRSRKA
ncbi:hypothetical protein BSLG_003092 [Batrachochytrium salamandrivorans]|nr:hypothetical protein BSLG_003092 [Batrachochytrium salamandrivorans]